jgi:hypothetical protein
VKDDTVKKHVTQDKISPHIMVVNHYGGDFYLEET